MSKTVLLTGASGFAGQCIIKAILAETDWQTYATWNSHNIHSGEPRVRCMQWDFCGPITPYFQEHIDYVIHCGAYVHALKSLERPLDFVEANVVGTANVLELARKLKPELFVYISTAEVLGGRNEGYSTEDDPMKPSNPYAATKAAGELLVYSYFRAFDLPTMTIRTMNLFGDDQTDETKFVPMVRKCLREDRPVPIHVRDGKPGQRQWLEGSSFASQLLHLIRTGIAGATYHIVGEELTNLQVAQRVADQMGIPLKIEMVRIGRTHEFRYGIQRTR